MDLKVTSIPASAFQEYRHDVIFKAYKWDLQAGEQSTIGDKVILLEPTDARFLAETAISLYHETVAMERALKNRPDLGIFMGISKEMATAIHNCTYEPETHIRLMRFDFHPTESGWAISEVNSDVAAGYPEASILPLLAEPFFDGYTRYGDFRKLFADSLKKHVPNGGTIAYLHDTRIVEDYQILRFLGDTLERAGYQSVYLSPGHIKWNHNKAIHTDGIVRCFPVEFLEYTNGVDWISFLNSHTPSCNHPMALLTQSKRLPLVWDQLDIEVSTWREMLPETVDIAQARQDQGFILKPAFGRTGEGINIPGTVSEEENREIISAAHKSPDQWVAQKRFQSKLFYNMHLCIGAFVINGQFAGFYGRVSDRLKIDADASDVPVLVRK
ncbi:MAG: glutathionylspermidine synthase family protein [Oscillospiraceae bacterium]|nr:glutathionylspermidine synthase family protein [Oscillospiraceae bacterium]